MLSPGLNGHVVIQQDMLLPNTRYDELEILSID